MFKSTDSLRNNSYLEKFVWRNVWRHTLPLTGIINGVFLWVPNFSQWFFFNFCEFSVYLALCKLVFSCRSLFLTCIMFKQCVKFIAFRVVKVPKVRVLVIFTVCFFEGKKKLMFFGILVFWGVNPLFQTQLSTRKTHTARQILKWICLIWTKWMGNKHANLDLSHFLYVKITPVVFLMCLMFRATPNAPFPGLYILSQNAP